MLGFSKIFVFILFISLIIWWKMGLTQALILIGIYAVIKIIYKFLT
jgi:hypothetical protein